MESFIFGQIIDIFLNVQETAQDGNVRAPSSTNRGLQWSLGPAPQIILMALFCRIKSFLSEARLPKSPIAE